MAFAFIFSDVGVGEWFVLLAVVLVVVGPKRLPEAARALGRWYSRICRVAEGFKRQLMDMEAEIDRAANEADRVASVAFTVDADKGGEDAAGAKS
jgi:Tat protein translocase TatB subunit